MTEKLRETQRRERQKEDYRVSNIPIIGGRHGVVYGIDGCRYWAKNGLIKFEEVDGNYGVITARDALKRVQGINDLYGRRQFEKGFHTADEVDAAQKFIQQMIELIRKAKEQGTPDDPTAREDRKRRRPATVRIPKSFESF